MRALSVNERSSLAALVPLSRLGEEKNPRAMVSCRNRMPCADPPGIAVAPVWHAEGRE